MVNDNVNFNNIEDSSDGFNIKHVIIKLFIYWKWIALSVILSLACAYLYLQKQTPVYKIQASVMINDKQKGSYQDQMMALQQDFGIMTATGGLDNEIEIMKSKSMLKQTVLDLDLYVTYTLDNGFWKPSQVLYGSYPVNLVVEQKDVEKMTSNFSVLVKQPTPDSYVIEYAAYDSNTGKSEMVEKELATLPYALNTHIGTLLLTKGDAAPLTKGQELIISVVPPISKARACLGALSIEPTSKNTAIANISYLDVNTRRGIDFVNQLVVAYNRENNNDKNLVAIKTEEFVKRRLAIVARELDETEEKIAQFKRSLGLINVGGDAQKILDGSSKYEDRRVEISTQLSMLDYLRDYINNPQNHLQAMPVNVGVLDATLTSQISNYNQAVLERNRLLRTASENNPAVIDLTTTAELMVETIRTSLESCYNSLIIQKRDVEAQAKMFSSKIGDVPTQEKILAAYQRQLEVKSGLYMMLLQKSEENAIALSATTDNAKIIDAALANYSPISPKRSSILLIALVIGLGLPIACIYIVELLRYKIEGRNDLERLTKVPILGDVAVAHNLKNGQRGIVVRENDNDMMAETFRSLRTNLQFLLEGPDKKVIQFTSTISGEGKTFISSNLAMSMALLGKKVILLGLDIRKPRLAEMFGFKDYKKGITTFLAGDPNDRDLLFEQILSSGINENLDILPAGIVPPNPAELLSKVNLDNAIKFLSEKYDYILLDTAPVGLVTDTLIIARVADASVYVCRADYTAKNDLNLVNSLFEQGKLKNMSLVLNGVDMTKRKYGYYYGYGSYGKYGRYGYGKYGYGHYGHYGYGNTSSSSKR